MPKSASGGSFLSHSLGYWVPLNWICPLFSDSSLSILHGGPVSMVEPASCGPVSMHLRQMKASVEASMSFDKSPIFLIIRSYC